MADMSMLFFSLLEIAETLCAVAVNSKTRLMKMLVRRMIVGVIMEGL